MSSFELEPVPNGNPLTGGLSFSNGNCVVVVREADGTYLIWDSKLGGGSPIWRLSGEQFHRLGRAIVYAMGRDLSCMPPVVLSDGVVFAMRRTGRNEYTWRLTDEAEFSFTFEEITAFYWGYHRGQFPVNSPLQRLVSVMPSVAGMAS